MNPPRTLFSRFIILAIGLLLTHLAQSEAATRPETPDIAGLVRRLGSTDFKVRELASRELFRIGLPAKQPLLEGANDPDPEVRRRCRDLLPRILEADRQAKLAAFLADTDGKLKHDLPGWERYRKIAGEDDAARRFFADIQKGDVAFLRDAEKDPDHAGERCGALCQLLIQRQQAFQFRNGRVESTQIPLTEIAPMLLVAADAHVRIPVQQRYLFTNLLYQPAVQENLRKSGISPFKKIVLAWMEHEVYDETTSGSLFHVINQLGLKEGLDMALKAVRSKKLKGPGLAGALVTIGKFGDKEHVELMESFLDDKTAIGGFNFGRANGGNVGGNTQVRDAALAMLVRLTKQSAKDYGFAITEIQPALDHLMDYANCLGFSSEERRTKAFEKWKTWKAARKK
ncbi:MAG TPA: hypothetical protein VH643_41595 [Gemmataceae bacterium]|jgi:hypothetical protein